MTRGLILRLNNEQQANFEGAGNAEPYGKKKVRYQLSALLAQCDSTAPKSQDMALWQAMAAVGREKPGFDL